MNAASARTTGVLARGFRALALVAAVSVLAPRGARAAGAEISGSAVYTYPGASATQNPNSGNFVVMLASTNFGNNSGTYNFLSVARATTPFAVAQSSYVIPFRFVNVPDGQYVLSAYRDIDGLGEVESHEPWGQYQNATSTTGAFAQFISVQGGVVTSTPGPFDFVIGDPEPGKITGTVTYTGAYKGTMFVEARVPESNCSGNCNGMTVAFTTMSWTGSASPVPYTLLVPPATGYTVNAYLALGVSADHGSDTREPSASATLSPADVAYGAATLISNANLTLVDPGTNGASFSGTNTTLIGTVTYSGALTGKNIVVMLLNSLNGANYSTDIFYKTTLTSTGPFTIPNISSAPTGSIPNTYAALAFVDADGSGLFRDTDPVSNSSSVSVANGGTFDLGTLALTDSVSTASISGTISISSAIPTAGTLVVEAQAAGQGHDGGPGEPTTRGEAKYPITGAASYPYSILSLGASNYYYVSAWVETDGDDGFSKHIATGTNSSVNGMDEPFGSYGIRYYPPGCSGSCGDVLTKPVDVTLGSKSGIDFTLQAPTYQPPAVPADFRAAARTTGTITWGWTPPSDVTRTGFRLVSSASAPVSVPDLPSTASSFLDGAGGASFSTNTLVQRALVSFNVSGLSTTTFVNAFTAAMPASGTYVNQVGQNSITASWYSNTNPAWTNFALQASTDSGFGVINASSQTLAQTGTLGLPDTAALASNTTYYIRVVAYNGDGVAAAPDVVANATATLANAPSTAPFSGLTSSGLTLAWGANTNPGWTAYKASISTDPAFGTLTASSQTLATSVAFAGLSANTTYYGTVAATSVGGNPTAAAQSSTSTLAALPAASSFTFIGDHDYTVSWSTNGNSASTLYEVGISSDGFADVASSGVTTSASLSQFGALQANTTYQAQVRAVNNNGVPTAFVVAAASSTNPDAPLSAAPSGIGTFSLSENWLANTNSTTTLFNVQIATDPAFGTITDSALKTGLSASFSNLSAATQYYGHVRALGNNSQYTTFTALPSTFTFILPPGPAASTFTAVDTMDATYNWSLTSSSGTLPPGTAFVAQASTSNFIGGTVLSSTTYNTNAAFASLTPNTTYFFQVESSNTVNVSGFVNMASTTTPAAQPLGLVSGSTATTSVVLSWNANANPPGTMFELWRDTTSAFGAPVKTALTAVSTTVASLTPNSTYYFKVRALGNDGHYTAFDAGPLQVVATLPTAPSSAAVTGLGVSSMTANWGANTDPAGTEYYAQISTMASFTPLTASTVTTANAYAFTSLGSNTTYFLQVQALGFGGVNSAQTALPTTVTFANVPASPAALNANLTSVGLSWANGGNAAGTLFNVQIATDPAFGSVTDSSQTVALASTFTALSSNATYYLRVQAVNNQGVGTLYATVTTTSTMVAAPVAAAYTAVSSVSVTANWGANGNGPTLYTVLFSTDPGFGAFTSSRTYNVGAAFGGLNPSTTYYAEVAARGNDGSQTAYTSLASTLTFLSAPFGGTFSNVSASAATVGWSSTNGAGTTYLVDISTVASFTPLWSSSSTPSLTATFGTGGQGPALGPNVTYYFQVQAQQPSNGQDSLFVFLGSTVTPVNQPSGTTLVNVTSTTFTLNWAAAGNPAGTTFEVWTDVSSGFTSPTKKSVALTTATISGLTNNSTYYFEVRAVNFAGVASTFDTAQSTVTLPPAPAAPGAPAGTALGVSSVSWTWTAATYASTYTVFSASAGVPIAGGSPLTYKEVGLSTNTPAGIYVAGDNGSGTGALSAQTTVYTLAMAPTGTAFSNVISTQALLSWGLDSNPSTTTAELQRSTDDVTFTTVFASTPSASAGVASYLDTGVIGCTTYYYRVRDWNGSGIATGFDTTVSFQTAGTTPSAAVGLVASPAANNYIDLSWTQSPTEGISSYKLYFDSGTGVLNGTPLEVLSSTVTSLTVGPFVSSAAYTFKLDAVHRCGIEETTGVTAISPSTGTLANVRASIASPLSGQRINGNAVTLQASLDAGDPTQVSQVTFQFRQHGTTPWTTIPSGDLNATDAATHPNPATSSPYLIHLDADAHLTAGTSYDFRAVAVNVAGSSDTAPSAVTLQDVMAGLTAPDVDVAESIAAGVVTKTVYVNSSISNTLRAAGPNATDPVITVLIPGGALTGLSTTTVLTQNIVAISTPGPSGLTGIGNAVEIKINGQATTYLANGSQASVTISYPATQNPSALQVWAYNETTHSWGPLSTSALDTVNHTITGLTSHFSIFQIFPTAATVQPDTSKVRVYPVPFRPNSANPDEGRAFAAGDFRTGIIFDNLPGTATIKIYTVSGRLVDEFDASTTNGKVQWDVRNRDGRDVASGGYFAVISSPGSKTIVRKLLIIR